MAVPTPPPPSSRRAFLAQLSAGAMAGTVAHGRGDDADDLAAALRLCDLSMTADERAQAKDRLVRQRNDYAALRQESFPFELAPSTTFDPFPPWHARPLPGAGMTWTPARDLPPPDNDIDLAFADVHTLASWLRQGTVTSRRLTELCLLRLRRFDQDLFCTITLLADEALATADERDRELRGGHLRGPLHGIPYGAKDLFAWPGAPTTFGAKPWAQHVWNVRATPLQKLADQGAVLVAKLSLGALAMGDLWHGGRTRSPWNKEQGSSGSSAGSCSAVAAGLLPFALGTETLGSIISPCRQCGVGGLRPTFGAVSRYGAMPLSWTMDKVGVIARSAIDLGLVFDAIRGSDGKDGAVRDAAFPFAPDAGLDGLRLGVVTGDNVLQRDEDRGFLQWLEQQGARPVPVTLPAAPYQALLLMLHAESAAAFDEFLRQGRLAELPGQGDGDWPNQFRSARAVPAVEYVQASRRRAQLCADMAATLADIDVCIAPTHGGPTLVATNLTGQPTMVLPIGRSERDAGKPLVLALVGTLHGEAAVLRVAAAWQRTTDWHRQRPRLTS